MKTEAITTAATAAFALFALWWITRNPTKLAGVAPVLQPAQVQRNTGMQDWMDVLTGQWADMHPELPQATYDETDRLLKRYPAPTGPTP